MTFIVLGYGTVAKARATSTSAYERCHGPVLIWERMVCKICENQLPRGKPSYFDDFCDGCAGYDWGHWRVGGPPRYAFLFGAAAGFIWGFTGSLRYNYPQAWILALFAAAVAGLVAWAVVFWLGDRLVNRFLTQTEPSDSALDRAREAEKFYYICFVSACQGKVSFAMQMLEQAARRGWHDWRLLISDPRARRFASLAPVREHLAPNGDDYGR